MSGIGTGNGVASVGGGGSFFGGWSSNKEDTNTNTSVEVEMPTSYSEPSIESVSEEYEPVINTDYTPGGDNTPSSESSNNIGNSAASGYNPRVDLPGPGNSAVSGYNPRVDLPSDETTSDSSYETDSPRNTSSYEDITNEKTSNGSSNGVNRKPVKISKTSGDDDLRWKNAIKRRDGVDSPIKNGGSLSKPAITGIGSRELIAQIDVNRSTLEENSKKIKLAAEKLDKIWSDVKTNQVGKINSSWVSEAAEEYTSKVLNMESKVNAVKSALVLIANTYDKSINEIDSKQKELKSKIQGI